MKSKVIKLAVASVVSISSLFLSITVSSVASSANAQKVKETVNPNQGIKKRFTCSNPDTVAFYKAVDEFNTRTGIGVTYNEFRGYYTDLAILRKRASGKEGCIVARGQLDTVMIHYQTALMLFGWKRTGRHFIGLDDSLVTDLGKAADSLHRYDNTVACDELAMLYMSEAVKEFNTISDTTEVKL